MAWERIVTDLHVVIMAGGSGTRFWPLSRRARPKQLLPVLGTQSLLELTVERALALVPPERVLIVTGGDHADAVRELLPALPGPCFLVEPVGRNTAPCIGLAASRVAATSPDAVLAVLPADHYIGDTPAFVDVVGQAEELARQGWLVTLGVRPSQPETGYGYVRVGEPLGLHDASTVAAFVEKPDQATAIEYLASGRYLWNSGMFFFSAGRILEELRLHLPEQAAALARIEGSRSGTDHQATLQREYEAMEGISIDFGVMERAERIAVVPATFAWSDVGHWAALRDVRERDSRDSVHQGRVIDLDGRRNIIVAEGGLVAAVGVEGMIIVHAGDAVLVCPVDRAQDVRDIVRELEATDSEELL
jgi:mannose-1-phosphate guanylyltransferase